jgi:hypothetical protein
MGAIKGKKFHTVGTVPKSSRRNVEKKHTNTLPLTFLAWYMHFYEK